MVDDGDGDEDDEDDDDDDDDDNDDDDSKDISRFRGQILTRCHARDLTKHRSDWMFARKWHIGLWSFEDAQQ